MYSESTVEREPGYLTVAQLARRLQVSESTIYGWVDRDYIPFLIAGDLREGNLSLDCSRFARQESCCQQRSEPPHTQLHANQDWTLAEADRKRRKKRGLRAVRGKLTLAPGGCNQKGATG